MSRLCRGWERSSRRAAPRVGARVLSGGRVRRVLRQRVGDLEPRRLVGDEDVLAGPRARIVVERAHRDDRDAARGVRSWHLGAAGRAERLREALGLRHLVRGELRLAAREAKLVEPHAEIRRVRGRACAPAAPAVAVAAQDRRTLDLERDGVAKAAPASHARSRGR